MPQEDKLIPTYKGNLYQNKNEKFDEDIFIHTNFGAIIPLWHKNIKDYKEDGQEVEFEIIDILGCWKGELNATYRCFGQLIN